MKFDILMRETSIGEMNPVTVSLHLRTANEVWLLFNGKSYYFLPHQLIELAGALEAAMRVRKL